MEGKELKQMKDAGVYKIFEDIDQMNKLEALNRPRHIVAENVPVEMTNRKFSFKFVADEVEYDYQRLVGWEDGYFPANCKQMPRTVVRDIVTNITMRLRGEAFEEISKFWKSETEIACNAIEGHNPSDFPPEKYEDMCLSAVFDWEIEVDGVVIVVKCAAYRLEGELIVVPCPEKTEMYLK